MLCGIFLLGIVWGGFCAGFVKATKPPPQQHFLQTPTDLVAVEGSTVDLTCQVGALAGDVQWSKDGFLLGFDAKIPGYIRYSMVVDVSRGIYNLRIHNVQMDDQAEYQCQVGPALNNLPIRAHAKVSVIVPPRVLEVKGYKNGSTVEMREGQKLTLQCIARNSKPATRLRWTKNGVEVNKDTTPVKEEDSSSSLKTTSTSITLSPKLDDNGAIYSCVGEHTAVPRPFKTNVFLSILYPPGPPQIEGYHDGDIVQVGDKLNLACVSRGGNPAARLIWFRNDDQVDVTYSTGGKEATNTHTFSVGPRDNRATYRCDASNTVTTQPLSASVRLNVLFAPTKVSIGGPKEVRVGESVRLSCRTGSSNPPVEVSWVVDGRPVISTQAVQEDPQGGWVTSSNVTVSVSRQDPDTKSFSCYAVSEALGETIVQTYTVAVVYPPSAPVIGGYEAGKSIKAGDIQKFTCTSTGGNPPATLKWFKNDKEVRGSEKITAGGSTSELVIRAEASDNGAIYRCEASNSALHAPIAANVTPAVLFPPSSVSIKLKPRKPKAGDVVTLTCETGSSNPESTVLWWREGESIDGFHEGVVDSSHGGKSTRNRVRFNVTSADDVTTYTCQATNHVLRRTVHESYLLRVLYKPEFLLPQAERFDVLEGESTVVNATARAHPTQITYSWTRNALPLLDLSAGTAGRSAARAAFRGPLLEISDVTREDGGEYGCEAANTEGVTWTSVSINVIFPARITQASRLVLADPGSTALFSCDAAANPFVSRMIRWRRPGLDLSLRGRETELEKGRAELALVNVTRKDAGMFECVAYNGVGEADTRQARLVVKFRPEVRLPSGFSDVAGGEGESARLVCLAEGAPAIAFTWTYQGGVVGGAGGKYASQAAQLDEVTWESVLFVKLLEAGDFGYYTCVARNELGHDHVKVKLRRRGPPDPPYSIRIVNTSSDSVVLSWTPGFSSGLPQQFRIRLVPGSDPHRPAYADVYPTNTTVFAVTGLEPGTEYTFSLSARNMLGESVYSKENTRAITQKSNGIVSPPTGASLSEKSDELPRLLLVVVSVVGTLLLVLNIGLLVACFVRRRNGRGIPKALPQTPDSLMYTPSKYQQTINGEAICQIEEQEEILMKELYEAKKQVVDKCIPGFQTASPYDMSQTRKKDNCPDILKNRGMDHVSLQSVPLDGTSSDISTLSDDHLRYTRRGILLPDSSPLRHATNGSADSCVMGSVGSHLV